jgi:hypothetical protein
MVDFSSIASSASSTASSATSSFSLPSLSPATLTSISNVSIPGVNLSASAASADAAAGSALSALPSASSITSSLTPGGAGLPSITSLFGPLNASPVAIPGLDTIQSTITSYQSNIGLHLSVMQAGIQNQVTTASQAGTAVPDPNTVASGMASNIFAPLTGIASVVSNAVSSGLSSIATQIGLGPAGNPSAAAASVGSSMTSSVSSLTSQSNSAISDIVAPLKAGAMANMLSGPMGQLPSVQSMMGSIGVTAPNSFAVARNLNSSMPVPDVMPKGPYDHSNLKSSDPAGNQPPASVNSQVTQAMCDFCISNYKTQAAKTTAYYGGNATTNTAEQNQALYDPWIDGLLGSEGASIRDKHIALVTGKPDSSTWTADEQALDDAYQTMWKSFSTTNTTYLAYQNDKLLKAQYRLYGLEVLNALSGQTSKYQLSADCQKYLTTNGVFG